MRMYFFINGKRVQNVGLRAKLMLDMDNLGLVGQIYNVPTETSVSIQAWGKQKSLHQFFEFVKEKRKPKESMVTQPVFDDQQMPSQRKEMRRHMLFSLEQMDKFIGVGIGIQKEIKEMRKELTNGFDKVVTAIQK